MKLPDYDFKSVPQELVDFSDDVKVIVNFGKYSHQVVSTPPTWSARNGEAVFYSKDNDNGWFYYIDGQWNRVDFSTSIINSWITFSSTGNAEILDSLNVTSFSIGFTALQAYFTITWDQDYSSPHYAWAGICKTSQGLDAMYVCASDSDLPAPDLPMNPTAGTLTVRTITYGNNARDDSPYVAVGAIGNR